MKAVQINVPEDAQRILNTLRDNGYEAYVVGGCVRDSLMGVEPKDWDICTNAIPTQVMDVFKGYEIIPTGLQHGTVTVMINKVGYEITTYRIDGEYSDGRHPDNVEYVSDLRQDLERRDFTINAMAYTFNETTHSGELIDFFGGVDDLQSGVIKCVGSPIVRFTEDPLRILRALRFASVLGFEIEADTQKAIFGMYQKLTVAVAKERINVEFSKILQGQNNVNILRKYIEVFEWVIPDLKGIVGFEQHNPYHKYDVFEHTLRVVAELDRSNLPLLLAGLFHDLGKPKMYRVDEVGIGHFGGHPKVSKEMTEQILKDLKYSNEVIDRTLWLVENHDTPFLVNKKYLRKILRKASAVDEDAMRLMRELWSLRVADVKAQSGYRQEERLSDLDKFKELMDSFKVVDECFTIKHLDINGYDLMEVGIPKGKQMGVLLKVLLEQVINEEVPNEKKALLKEVEKWKEVWRRS